MCSSLIRQVLSIGQTYVSYKNLTTWGWNKHLWDVPITNHEHLRLGAWLLEFFFLLSMACTKISILFVYRRISNGSNNRCFIRLTWAAIAFTAAYASALTLYLFLICHPMDSYWKGYSPFYNKPYKCGDERVPIILSVVLNVTSDIYATLLPMFLVRKLRLSRKQRIGLVLLFSVGILTIVTGAARIYFIEIVTTNYKPGPHTHDVTWPGWPLYVSDNLDRGAKLTSIQAWTDIETHLAIICASAPALKVIFVKKLKSPLAKIASRPTLPRSRSGASSSKGLISWPGSQQRQTLANREISKPRLINIEVKHEPSAGQMEAYKRDVEKFPLEQIVHVGAWKPLPILPSPSPSPEVDSEAGRSSVVEDDRSSFRSDIPPTSRASSGDFLPIYISGSLPPVTRKT